MNAHHEADRVAALRAAWSREAVAGLLAAILGHGFRVDLVLVVQCLVAARPQDGLPEPTQPQHEQQCTHDDPQGVDRHVAG